MIQHINKKEDKKSNDHLQKMQKETFDKIQYPLMTENFMKLGKEITCLNIIETIYDSPIANITLSDKKQNKGVGLRDTSYYMYKIEK